MTVAELCATRGPLGAAVGMVHLLDPEGRSEAGPRPGAGPQQSGLPGVQQHGKPTGHLSKEEGGGDEEMWEGDVWSRFLRRFRSDLSRSSLYKLSLLFTF